MEVMKEKTMKRHRVIPGAVMAVMGVMLVWGSMQVLSAQETEKQSKTHNMMSSKNMKSEKIIDKIGGTAGIETLTDKFLHGLKGMDENMPMPGASGSSGSGMGNATQASYDYTAVREHVRASLCKAAGGDCKVYKLTKNEKMNQPVVSDAQWDAAVKDFKTTLGTYNLTDKEQDKLLASVTSMKKDLMSGKGTMSGTEMNSNMKDEKKDKSGKGW
jgi:hypothetical protein